MYLGRHQTLKHSLVYALEVEAVKPGLIQSEKYKQKVDETELDRLATFAVKEVR